MCAAWRRAAAPGRLLGVLPCHSGGCRAPWPAPGAGGGPQHTRPPSRRGRPLAPAPGGKGAACPRSSWRPPAGAWTLLIAAPAPRRKPPGAGARSRRPDQSSHLEGASADLRRGARRGGQAAARAHEARLAAGESHGCRLSVGCRKGGEGERSRRAPVRPPILLPRRSRRPRDFAGDDRRPAHPLDVAGGGGTGAMHRVPCGAVRSGASVRGAARRGEGRGGPRRGRAPSVAARRRRRPRAPCAPAGCPACARGPRWCQPPTGQGGGCRGCGACAHGARPRTAATGQRPFWGAPPQKK